MFEMKKEFESVEKKNDSVDILLSDYDINLYKDNFESLTKEMDILSNMDNALSWFNVDDISYETAINNLERVIDGTGFTIDDFGLSAGDNYTIESGSDSKFNKIWEWIKNKLKLLKNYLLSVFDALIGKYAGPRMIAVEIEKDIKRAFSGVNTESALTHESSGIKISPDSLLDIPGNVIFLDIKKAIKLIEGVSLNTYRNSVEPLLSAIEIIKKETIQYISTGKHNLDKVLNDHFSKFTPSGLSKYVVDNTNVFKDYKDHHNCLIVHKFIKVANRSEAIVSFVNTSVRSNSKINVNAIKFTADLKYNSTTEMALLDADTIILCSQEMLKLINDAEERSKKTNDRLKKGIMSLDSIVSKLNSSINNNNNNNIKYDSADIDAIKEAVMFCNKHMSNITLSYVDNIDLYLSLGKVLNLHKKELIKSHKDK